MIPVRCISKHNPDAGTYGDCYRACLASILEMPADQVPHFIEARRGAAEWRDDERAWLRARGFDSIVLTLQIPLPELLTYMGKGNPGVHYIVGGVGVYGQPHAVVACGDRIAHDPGDVGIVAPIQGHHILTFVGQYSRPSAAVKPRRVIEMAPLDRHERIGLLFSGGKDSLALLHLLRQHWPRLTVYHVDAGDLLPETREIVAAVEAMVPNFFRIETDSKAWRVANGMPADIVPWTCTPMGRTFPEGGRLALVDRFQCCRANIWEPAFQRARADGVTLEIIGTKNSDPGGAASRLVSGFEPGSCTVTREGVERWLPLHDWTDAEVFDFLREVRAPIARYYDGGKNAKGPECATCTAYCDEGRAAYLRKYHPALASDYLRNLEAVAAEMRRPFLALTAELDAAGILKLPQGATA